MKKPLTRATQILEVSDKQMHISDLKGIFTDLIPAQSLLPLYAAINSTKSDSNTYRIVNTLIYQRQNNSNGESNFSKDKK